ncbi:MAG: ATP-binding protein [Chloroflexi bacterium]|nr:ATP-binding protein [Chloroflexota bacterium]
MTSRQYRTRLRQIIDTHFSMEELRTLCSDLGVDYDGLPGEGKMSKARELVNYLNRHDRISDLVELGEQRRPNVSWQHTPEKTEAIHVSENEFVNREDELNLLQAERLRASRSPYTLISAPAGYGKTYLLQYLIHTIESDEALRQKWCTCYASVDSHVSDQIADVTQAITGSPVPDATPDLVCNHVIQKLGAPLPNGRRTILLAFDTVEQLDEKATQWLCAFLHTLHRRTRLGYQEIITVRVIIAGRTVESFWESYEQAYPKPPAPQRISLSPFNAHTIQELIWKQAQAARIDLDDQTVVQIADQVLYLSGGHPTIIHNLVNDLASQFFAIGSVSEYFEQRREQLVQTVLTPVANDVRDSLISILDAQIRDAVQALSIFRRVNANTVQALIEAEMLPPGTDEINLLGDMQKARILNGPGIREPFYRNWPIRQIWALNMACESREQYQHLNQIALDLYKSWIHNLGQGLSDTPLKATQRLLSVVEWLFHALQKDEVDENDLRAELQGHVQVLSEGNQRSLVADLIADEITQDTKVCHLLRQRLGKDGVSIACDWLQAR